MDDEIRRQGIEDATYEFRMMHAMASILVANSFHVVVENPHGHPEDERAKIERGVGNALLESMLVHARSLIEFFFEGDRRDFTARTYLPPSARSFDRSEILSAAQKERIDQRLSHLSRDRSTHDREWDLPAIWLELDNLRREFNRRVDPIYQITLETEVRLIAAGEGEGATSKGLSDLNHSLII
jgi:hypothetical protein